MYVDSYMQTINKKLNMIVCKFFSDAKMFGAPIPATDQNQYNKISEDMKSMRDQDKLVCICCFEIFFGWNLMACLTIWNKLKPLKFSFYDMF